MPVITMSTSPIARCSGHASCGACVGQRTTKIVQAAAFGIAELAGFEPATSSLRTMCTKRSDQEKRRPSGGLWRGCGTSDVRRRET